MVTKLNITDFKSHSNLSLDLKNLTLLVGTNSSGKSSIIQSLLLVTHNVSNKHMSPLNGHLISLGSFQDVANFATKARSFKIDITNDSEQLDLLFTNPDNSSDGKVKISTLKASTAKLFKYANGHVHYLSANRIGSQDLYNKNIDKYDNIGINGEYAIDYYQSNKSKKIDEALVQDRTISYFLSTQVNYWLNKIVKHELVTTDISGTNYVLAEFEITSNKAISTTWSVKPKNTGSGVSYLLSIIIMCLASKPGDLVMIENPEIHLHPKAQSLLVEFLVFISRCGVQLIIETHSDHILNGFRVQVYNKAISSDNLAVHFFTKNEETLLTEHTIIPIDSEGGINDWPENFFDQATKDLNHLFGI